MNNLYKINKSTKKYTKFNVPKKIKTPLSFIANIAIPDNIKEYADEFRNRNIYNKSSYIKDNFKY